MTQQVIHIKDQGIGDLVEASLVAELTARDLITVELIWGPERHRLVSELIKQGQDPQSIPRHYNWDWSRKARKLELLATQCYGIVCQGAMQGLMMIKTAGYQARLDPDKGKPLVYIDYLEAAPWNTSLLTAQPRYSGVGTKLFEAAVAVSRNEEFHGRVGLHSLPQSEDFYCRRCHMTTCGIDPDYENLSYFELTRSDATAYWQEN